MPITARTLPVADGTEVYTSAIILAGASAATSVFKAAPVSSAGVLRGQNLAAGNTTLTLALARSGPLYATAAANTTLFVPLLANFTDLGGYTFDPNVPNGLIFAVERQGTGVFALNFAVGVTIQWNDLDTAFLPRYHGPVMLRMVALNTWVAS